MKTIRTFLKTATWALFAAVLSLSACSKPAGSNTPGPDIDYYTCSMHPSVHLHDPDAKCPICGMDLVPVKKQEEQEQSPTPTGASATPEKPHEFTIPLNRQQLIGVTYAQVTLKPLRRTIRAVGRVEATMGNHWDYVSRVEGYVHDLNVVAPGQKVKKGELLMDLYSPDLVATEQEFIDLLKMRDQGRTGGDQATLENAEHLLAGARARLSQWNISPEQIEALEKSRAVGQYLPLNSPFDGVAEEIPVHQGRHVSVGDHLVDIVNLASVWVWAEFYEDELPSIKAGLPVTIDSPAEPGLTVPGKIALLDPFINEQTRTGRVRIDVDNPGGKLRPGAYVDVMLHIDAGEGLVVPLSAVLPTGAHNIVFVDKGDGRLEPRFVRLGGKFGDEYKVESGLAAGERVVASGNFLIDAESKLQGALKEW